MVIDWTGASRGDGDVDAALAWTLMACGGIPFGKVKAVLLGRVGRCLSRPCWRRATSRALRQALPTAVDWKLLDHNMTESERAALRGLVATNHRRS